MFIIFHIETSITFFLFYSSFFCSFLFPHKYIFHLSQFSDMTYCIALKTYLKKLIINNLLTHSTLPKLDRLVVCMCDFMYSLNKYCIFIIGFLFYIILYYTRAAFFKNPGKTLYLLIILLTFL